MKCRNTVVKYQSVLKFSLNFLKIFFKLSLNSAVPTESAHLCFIIANIRSEGKPTIKCWW